jgi:hypothetical protein
MQSSQPTGIELRDGGTEAVLEPRPIFKELVSRVIDALVQEGKRLTAETVREEFLTRYSGCPAPHHNAWGAAILSASKRGVIRPTGKYVQTLKPASHARKIQVWEPAARAA